MNSVSLRSIRKRTAIAILWCSVAPALALAQAIDNPSPSMPSRGFYPGGSYSLSEIESVDNLSGNVILKFPLAKLPPGRAGSSFVVDLIYNSSIYDVETTNDFYYPGPAKPDLYLRTQYVPSDTGGWRYGYEYQLRWDLRAGQMTCANTTSYYMYRPYIVLPDASSHALYLEGFAQDTFGYNMISPYGSLDAKGGCPFSGTVPAKLVYYTTDGSYIRVEVTQAAPPAVPTWTMFLPDGTQVAGGGPESGTFTYTGARRSQGGNITSITDKNGNTIHFAFSCADSSPCVTEISDDLGRTITITPGTNQDVITWPGPPKSPTLTAYVNWTYESTESAATYQCVSHVYGPDADPNSSFPCYVGATAEIPYRGSFPVPSPPYPLPQDAFSWPVVSSIQLPTDTTGLPSNDPQWRYNFGYTFDPSCPASTCAVNWGELHTMTLPSQATVGYLYYFDSGNGGRNALYSTHMINPLQQKTLAYTEKLDTTATAIKEITTYTAYNVSGASSETHPDGTTTQFGVCCTPLHPMINQVVNPDGSTVQRVWSENGTPNVHADSTGAGPIFVNPYVSWEAETVVDANGQAKMSSMKHYTVDQNGNNVGTDEYDWGPVVPTPFTGGSGTSKRSTVNTWTVSTPNATQNAAADSSNAYWNTSAPRNLRAKSWTTVSCCDAGKSVVAATSYTYYNTTWSNDANLWQDLRWDSTQGSYGSGAAVTTSRAYDTHGNVLTVTDPNGYVTQTTYDANGLYPTDQYAAYGQPEQRHTTFSYDPVSGVLGTKTDQDNGVSTAYTYDYLGRETLEEETASNLDRLVQTSYNDANLTVTSKRDQISRGDAALLTTTYYDPMGRVRMVDNGISRAQKAYRYGAGVSYQLSSNPYAAQLSSGSGGEPTMGWTLTTEDSMGRVISTAHYPGATPPAAPTNPPYTTYSAWGSNATSTGAVTTSYSAQPVGGAGPAGTTITVSDEAGNWHVSAVDGLGRMTAVEEATGAITSYTYDGLNNLTGVSMGTQNRTFSYSSLARLTSATNPESGTITYAYDARGNLTQRTDANLNILCVGDGPSSGHCPGTASNQPAYDGLGRPRIKTYTVPSTSPTAATPTVTYTYDQDTKGTLYQVANGASSTVYTHDNLGRIASSTQSTAGTAYNPFQYTWSLSDQILSMTYPSGRMITYGLDSTSARILTVAGTFSGKATSYAGSASSPIGYTAAGGFASVALGNGTTETYTWNDRLQQTGIALSSGFALHFYPCDGGQTACSNNNGNIWRETVQGPGLSGTATQEYRYDVLNRLQVAAESPSAAVTATSTCGSLGSPSWCQQYGYDAYGNRWVSASTGYGTSAVTPAGSTNFDGNNRLQVSGSGFDNAGNLQGISGYQFTYDAENRQVSAKVGGVTAAYVYDGEGRRVQKQLSGGATETYVYDAEGQLAAEYSSAPQTQTPPCTTCYLTADHLGSTRLMAGATGTAVSLHDYLPFGEELLAGTGGRSATLYGATDDLTVKFTGKERDAELASSAMAGGLDYFGARYYSGAQGRFTSPDPLYLEMHRLADPQQWNIYAYARNNPLKFTDPDGLDIACTGSRCDDYLKALGKDVSFKIDYDKNGKVVTVCGFRGMAISVPN